MRSDADTMEHKGSHIWLGNYQQKCNTILKAHDEGLHVFSICSMWLLWTNYYSY